MRSYLGHWDHSKPLARTKSASQAVMATVYAVVGVIWFLAGAWVWGVAWIGIALIALMASVYYRRREPR